MLLESIYIYTFIYINMIMPVKLFKALGDETRLNIVKFLMNGEKCVCEITPQVKRKQSTVSLQLAKLENIGVVSSRREGKKIYYKLTSDKVAKVINMVQAMK